MARQDERRERLMQNEQRRPVGTGGAAGYLATGHREDSPNATLGQAALLYAGYGWPVFPCLPRGKKPLGRLAPNGCKSATTDGAMVARWWRQEPHANIGIACGLAFWVLDVDAEDGGHEALEALEQRHGRLPDTVTQWTGSDGSHTLFAPDERVRNSVKKLGAGLDTRASGGYIIAWPSIHPNGQQYRWLDGYAPGERPIAEAPGWLLDLLDPPRPEPEPFDAANARRLEAAAFVRHMGDRYAAKAFEAELERVALAANGERNDALNRAAFSLGQLVADGLLAAGPVAAALGGAATAAGLDRVEIEKTLRSALKAGMASPRGVRP